MKLILFVLMFSCINVVSQPLLTRIDTIKVYNFGNQLQNPWAGGLNFTEWSAVDIDLDGSKDLAVFDKSGEIIRVYKNDGIVGTASYHHANQFQSAIPSSLSSWAIFYDYNNDGKSDLFTYALGLGGIRVYKNISSPGNPQFTLFKNFLKSDYDTGPGNNIANTPSSSVAIPGLADIDNDGDMDIICFQSSGTVLELHQNMSLERYGNVDSLEFDVTDKCWGNVSENNCMSELNYQFCPTFRKYIDIKNEKVLHSGSCLLCLDMDGDNDKDLLLADISCDSVEYFRNGGSVSNAYFDYTTKSFPDATNPITYKQFPCSYYLDVDNDNKRDLVSAPNIQASENYKSVWYYKNNGQDNAPNFQLIKKNFLQDQMIDLGEGAFPTSLDYDSDGDQDLLVGNFGYYLPVSNYSTKIALLENTGTITNPKFNLINTDYGGFSSLGKRNLAPTTGDLDGDGDKDLLIGDAEGRLNYYKNTGPIGGPANFVLESNYSTGIFAGIDVGLNAYPQLFDVNNDGLLDVVIGEYEGWLNYLKNRGTATAPNFDPLVTQFGNVHTIVPGYFEGQSTPCFFREGGVTKAFVGSERGFVYLYNNIDGNLNGSFNLMDSIYGNIREGENVAPYLYDFNNNGYKDLILGNYSGGISYYNGSSNSISLNENLEVLSELTIFPNPAQDQLHLQFNKHNTGTKTISLIDISGKKIMEIITSENELTIDLNTVAQGIYFLNIEHNLSENRYYSITKKIIKQ